MGDVSQLEQASSNNKRDSKNKRLFLNGGVQSTLLFAFPPNAYLIQAKSKSAPQAGAAPTHGPPRRARGHSRAP